MAFHRQDARSRLGLRGARWLVVPLGVVPAAALAADLAIFTDGRTLRVAGHRPDGDRITLRLEGGGEITLPRGRIRSIRPAEPGAPPVEESVASAPTAAEASGTAALAPGPPGIPRPPDPAAGDLFAQIADLALKYGLDTRLVAAVVLVESGLDPAAVSPKGAMGLMQLMPATATAYGVVNPFDPRENLEAGIAHLKDLLDRFGGDVPLALAGYNAGEAAVRRYGGIPPYAETIHYVNRVLALVRAR